MQTVQIQIPISLNDGHLLLVKIEDIKTPPRPGDHIWDVAFIDLMGKCGNRMAEITVEESGVDLDENTVVLTCREVVLDASIHKLLEDSACAGWGNDYEFDRN